MKPALIAIILSFSNLACAQPSSLAGVWKTYGDRTGQADGLVRIVEANGEFQGTVEAVFSPPAPSPNPRCEACSGELRGKPVVGMTILRRLRWDGEQFSGGEILDPGNGKVYRCSAKLTDAGRKLEVRGFIGIPLLGRTQTWERQR
jgi:uncharacterized protein (DUF2147 family)